jgi:hypothetical protein
MTDVLATLRSGLDADELAMFDEAEENPFVGGKWLYIIIGAGVAVATFFLWSQFVDGALFTALQGALGANPPISPNVLTGVIDIIIGGVAAGVGYSIKDVGGGNLGKYIAAGVVGFGIGVLADGISVTLQAALGSSASTAQFSPHMRITSPNGLNGGYARFGTV